ncbi:hypothetical protein BGZ79_004409 [Entomortierella chlamydospora]|nr:hypothetical protein BGZ79_004409 [Entomortierella chlamydospora]
MTEPKQLFRPIYKDEATGTITPLPRTVNINPRFDSKAKRQIILWNDIKTAFKNPVHVWHGDTIVPFLTDNDFEFLQPLRISTYPGIVLDVVIENPATDSGQSPRIQDSPLPTPVSSTTLSSHHSLEEAASTTNSQSPQTIAKNAPQDRGEPTTNSSSSATESVSRAPQFSPDFNNAGNFYSHTRLATGQCTDNGTADKQEYLTNHEKLDMIATYHRGLSYYEGQDVPQDYLKAMEWFLKAAKQGHPDAQNKLGYMYQKGQGVQQDWSMAAKWYHAAADQGYAKSQGNLGYMYQNGYGVTQDHAKAVDMYKKAVEQGYIGAHCSLGYMYECGLGVTRDHLEAAKWYKVAADQGHGIAQTNLGSLYRNGLGVAQDYSKAMDLYQKSAQQGNDAAQCNIAFMYQNGLGVTQDHSKAAEWYQKSADQGYAIAQFNLGMMYKHGNGVAQNLSKADKLLGQAASQGYIEEHDVTKQNRIESKVPGQGPSEGKAPMQKPAEDKARLNTVHAIIENDNSSNLKKSRQSLSKQGWVNNPFKKSK